MPGIPVTDYIDLQNNQARGLAAPTADDHAATKAYVDQIVRGLSWKSPVRVAASANINLASPGALLDGVSLTAGDSVLLYGQTTQSQNGVYLWNGAAVAMTRRSDADQNAEVVPGMAFPVTEGSNADKFAILTSDGAITVGTTALTFAILSSTGQSYTAGNGLQLSAGAFSVLLPANSGLTVSGSGLAVDTGVVARKYSQDIGNGSLTSITVTHNLGTEDVTVALKEVSSGRGAIPAVGARTTNSVTLTFGTAPTTGQYRVTVVG